MSEQKRKALLRRKERLGRKASYRKLGDAVGHSNKTVWEILKGKELAFDSVDVDGILDKIERALDEIEAEEDEEPEGHPTHAPA